MKKKFILLGAFLFILIGKFYILDIYLVKGDSMNPTISDKEYLIVSKLSNDYNKGDIILLNMNNEKYVKRIVGNEGDKIKFDGELYINDLQIELGSIVNKEILESVNNTLLGENDFFVIGDNVNDSIDSRFWGIINSKNLIGKIIKR